MEKKTIIAILVGVVLVVGAIFVSANLGTEEPPEIAKEAPGVCGTTEPACGAGACNFDCGGSCGVPSCGCS